MISIIIPAYNEEKTIGTVIDNLREILKHEKYEIIVIDDGSTDRTYKIIKSKKVKVIKRRQNFKGDYRGFLDALIIAKGDIIAKIDADLEHDPSDIIRAVRYMLNNQLDLVLGQRPRYSKWIEYVINKKYKNYFNDVLSGFILFNKKLNVAAIKYKLNLWIELPLFAIQNKYKTGEIKINYKKREGKPRFGGFFEKNITVYVYYLKAKNKINKLTKTL